MKKGTPPGRTPVAEAARQARLEREAAALRANLHRRKAQARSVENRTEPGTEPGTGEPDGAGLPGRDEPGTA